MIKRNLLLILFLAIVNLPSSSFAVEPSEILQNPQLETRARVLSKNIRCLVCQNQSIDDSNASLAKDLRKVVREQLVNGASDEEIFDYPFLYMLEVGQGGGLLLSVSEIENLREYLLRGGFLLIDDFWGQQQWDNFYASFGQVFPDREIIELDPSHEIFNVYYDIDGPQMIPALFRSDDFGEQGINTASNHAILDDSGRIMVLINWNSDMGDGWEHTYHPEYPTRFANAAYRLGINYLIYSMTH